MCSSTQRRRTSKGRTAADMCAAGKADSPVRAVHWLAKAPPSRHLNGPSGQPSRPVGRIVA